MTPWTRRSFLVAAGCGLAACTSTPPAGGASAARARSTSDVDAALAELYRTSPAPTSSAPAPRASW